MTCECGCGEDPGIRRRQGTPRRFVDGHMNRGNTPPNKGTRTATEGYVRRWYDGVRDYEHRKSDNRIENLELTTRSEHIQHHRDELLAARG